MKLASLFIAILLATACGKLNLLGSAQDSQQSSMSLVPESAMATLSQMASHTENSLEAGAEERFLTPTCYATRSQTRCSKNIMSLKYGGCMKQSSYTQKVSMNGAWTDVYDDEKSCTYSTTHGLQDGKTLLRRTSGVSTLNPNGVLATLSTTPHTAYDSTNISGRGIAITSSGGVRTINIYGARRILASGSTSGAAGNSALANLSQYTPSPAVVTGSLQEGTRNISNATVITYDNSERSVYQSQFENVKWEDPDCCFPTSGKITSSFNGQLSSGGNTLEFTNTCGRAKLTTTSGTMNDVTLSQCE